MKAENERIWVNGEPIAIAEPGMSVRSMLQVLSVEPRGIAVALDGVLIPRSEWDSTLVPQGSKVEIIGAAPGG
jgi:sulfur carrier protein